MSGDLVVKQMQIGQMANFVYLIGCRATGEATAVDPGWNAEAILRGAEAEGLRITSIFATHGHMDHVNALSALAERTGAAVYVNRAEMASIARQAPEATGLDDDAEVRVGQQTVRALHTPGHTPGSQCLLVGGRLLTGDTLFVGSIGRADLPGSSPAQLFDSLQRLKALPAETIVLPGHHYGDRQSSTIEHECRYNPYLRIPTLEAFLQIMGL